MKMNTKELLITNIRWHVIGMALMAIIALAAACFGAPPLGDADENGMALDGRDINLAVFRNDIATLRVSGGEAVEGLDRALVLRSYVERHNIGLAVYTDPRPGMSFALMPTSLKMSGDGKVQFGPAAANGKRLVAVNGDLVPMIPATGRLLGPVVKVNGNKVPSPLVGRLKSNNARGGWWWSNVSLPGSTADATVEWYLEYLESGAIQQTASVARVPNPVFIIRNLRLNPAQPEDGQSVTPSVTFEWMTGDSASGSIIGTLNGVPVDGVTTVAANPVSGTTTVTLPAFVVLGGTNTYAAQLRVGNVISTAEIVFSVQSAPPPAVSVSNLILIPSQPAAGQTVSARFTLATTSVITRAYSASATLNGASAGATGGTVPTGSTTQQVTLPAFVATGGSHTYQVLVAVAGVTKAITRTFSVPLVDFAVTSVAMASTATAGNNVTATVSAKANNLGAPFVVGLHARRNSVGGTMLASGSVSFTAGQTVTAQSALTFQATAGTTSVVFVIDPDNRYPEVSDVNSFAQGITVTTPPPPPAPTVTASNLVLSPLQPAAGVTVTASFSLVTSSTVARTFIATGTVDGGNAQTVTGTVNPGTITQTVTMPGFAAVTGTHTYRVSVGVSGVTTSLAATFTVTAPPPPPPAPDARMVSIQLTPSSPTAGQMVVPSVVYGISSTIPRNLTITGRLNGATSATFNGTAAAGNTTAAATLTGFTAVAGSHTYVASIVFSPSTTETNATNNDVTVTFTVPQPPTPTVSVEAVAMATSALQDTTVVATVTCRGTNIGAPTTATVRANAGSTVLTTGSVQFSAGTSVAATAVLRFIATVPAISPITFTVDGSSPVTRTLVVVQPDFTIISVEMASTATAGTTINAAVSGRVTNLGVAKTMRVEARSESLTGLLLGSATMAFTTGALVNTTATVSVNVMAGTSRVMFIINPNQIGGFEADALNNAFIKNITVTLPPGPATPHILAVTAGASSADIAWGAVANATSYEVSSRTTLAANAPLRFDGSSNTTSLTVGGLTAGSQVFIGVVSVNSGGRSPRSTEAAVVPGAGLSIKLTILSGTELQEATLQDPRSGFGNNRGWRFLNGSLWYTTRSKSAGTETFNITDPTLLASDSDFWERGNMAAEAGKILAYGANGTVAVVSAHRRADQGADLQYGRRVNGEVFTVAP